jgi:hypothetical protein
MQCLFLTSRPYPHRWSPFPRHQPLIHEVGGVMAWRQLPYPAAATARFGGRGSYIGKGVGAMASAMTTTTPITCQHQKQTENK